MRRTRLLLAPLLALGAISAFAQESAEVPPVEVLKVEGLLDQPAVEFLEREVRASAARGAQLVVIELDAPGVVADEVDALLDLISAPPLPVAVWVGPAPAVAHGAAAEMLRVAPLRAAAPGAVVGYRTPLVSGAVTVAPSGPVNDDEVVITAPVTGLVDHVEPALANLLTTLDGRQLDLAGGSVTIDTLGPALDADGNPVLDEQGAPAQTVVAEVRFRQPGVGTRLLSTATAPEATFLLIAAGLAVAVFEFYAAGPGVAAAVAAACLLLGGYGVTVLPVRWWALVLLLAGILLMAVEFQMSRFGLLSLLGTALLGAGGLFLTDAAPHFAPSWWAILLATAAISLFFFIALPTVVRARFSSPTVGREHLIGKRGLARTALAPDGEVEVDGARWKATSHRAAGIGPGDVVAVTAVAGTVLEVEPAADLE